MRACMRPSAAGSRRGVCGEEVVLEQGPLHENFSGAGAACMLIDDAHLTWTERSI